MGDTTENTTETFLLRLGGGGGIVAFDAPRRAAGRGEVTIAADKWSVAEGTCDTVAKANTPPAGNEL